MSKFTPLDGKHLLQQAPPQIDCGDCNKCCRNNQVVIITPEDWQNFYRTQQITLPNGRIITALQFQPNGDCIYLQDGKCSIHGQHPLICRAFSCLEQFRSYSRAERTILTKRGELDQEVLAEGRRRHIQNHKTRSR